MWRRSRGVALDRRVLARPPKNVSGPTVPFWIGRRDPLRHRREYVLANGVSVRCARATCRTDWEGRAHLATPGFLWGLWLEHVWLRWVTFGDGRGQGWLAPPPVRVHAFHPPCGDEGRIGDAVSRIDQGRLSKDTP
jgi:hypothetical protein